MKAVRRFGLIIAVLLLGLLIGKLGSLATIVIFSGLFLVWFMLWDERKYAQHYAERQYAEEDTEEEHYYKEPAEDFYYVTYDHHYHKSA
ncbi:hypothetical protein P7D85_07995 [Enterococcus hulanensis]|uniref:DUF2273 domain-containing protein n=1 Tax=Enterococcus hulanensis TaxID=2559929 RepID=A0ABU3EXW5_9ENTE|nr:hypothetical protein [Enterococcus hulanensis]MDT2599713.1 hypothetical protein [Enterococcus hulanensis]MDT2609431.1 hypothetical protein [Enterococcus hulanensis]MDT2616008.1 hypothetical protein [Enterococcus hulanensis]MDT2627952.1 hypothetical protein [Enterococcus hulanensis]MDT2655057.1 hypothetical protein [Enterococcus hulanensis]